MKSDEEIISLYKLRESRLSPVRKIARDVRNAYHGDIVLPLPELDANTRPMVANLVQLGIDQHARRIRSRMPVAMFLADGDTKVARERARDKRSIVANWHREERLPLKMMRLTRHWCAYTAAILTLTPSSYDRACWRVRDPLDALPPDSDPDCAEVTDCIFESTRTMGWMRTNYPQAALPDRGRVPDEGRTSLIEYIDAEERVFLASYNDIDGYNGATIARTIRLGRAPIELDLDYAPVAVGWRPGLARPSGQMDGVIGPYWAMAMLEALEMIAVKKSVFPNTWMIGQNGESPKILVEADGLRDIIGQATGVGMPWVDNVQPGFMAPQAIDRTERNIRVTAGVPADLSGESASNVRTGRRGDSILSSTIDFSIQEAQDVFASMLHCANRIAIEYDRQWYPATKKFYVRLGDREVEKSYTPNVLWANDRHTVDYAFSGTDAAGLVIQLGQELGTEMISHRSAMFISPHVDDPDNEHDQIQVEKLESALLQGLLAQAQQGALPPSDLARIMELVQNDVDLAKAVAQAHEEAQSRQAAQVPPTAPAAQPGIAQPGAGAESQPSIAPPSPGQRNIASLLSTIRRAQLQNTGPQ